MSICAPHLHQKRVLELDLLTVISVPIGAGNLTQVLRPSNYFSFFKKLLGGRERGREVVTQVYTDAGGSMSIWNLWVQRTT